MAEEAHWPRYLVEHVIVVHVLSQCVGVGDPRSGRLLPASMARFERELDPGAARPGLDLRRHTVCTISERCVARLQSDA